MYRNVAIFISCLLSVIISSSAFGREYEAPSSSTESADASSILDEVNNREYEVPPSGTEAIGASPISDEDMEYCVKIYNEAKWLKEEAKGLSATIEGTQVNRYNREAVDAYNAKVAEYNIMKERHDSMIGYFNSHCANRQAASAKRIVDCLNNSDCEAHQAGPIDASIGHQSNSINTTICSNNLECWQLFSK